MSQVVLLLVWKKSKVYEECFSLPWTGLIRYDLVKFCLSLPFPLQLDRICSVIRLWERNGEIYYKDCDKMFCNIIRWIVIYVVRSHWIHIHDWKSCLTSIYFFVIYFVGKHLNEENQEGDPKPSKDLGEMKKNDLMYKTSVPPFLYQFLKPRGIPRIGKNSLKTASHANENLGKVFFINKCFSNAAKAFLRHLFAH